MEIGICSVHYFSNGSLLTGKDIQLFTRDVIGHAETGSPRELVTSWQDDSKDQDPIMGNR